jgi:hypothetical protein
LLQQLHLAEGDKFIFLGSNDEDWDMTGILGYRLQSSSVGFLDTTDISIYAKPANCQPSP